MMPTLTLYLLRIFGHISIIPFGIRDRIIRWFFNPDTASPSIFDVKFFNHRYQGNLACFLDWEVFFYGAYEKPMLKLFRSIVSHLHPAPATFIDIGANVGHHTLFMSSYCHRVIAFEPFGEVFDQLTNKVLSNKLENVEAFNLALGSCDEMRRFHTPAGNNTGTGSFLDDYNPINNSNTMLMEVKKGSQFLDELKIMSPVIIKIDVEGFEMEVLKGLETFIKKFRPTIIMELSDISRERFKSKEILDSHLE